MIDSVLKGTGNSRFLKSAVPAGTSWADALAMLQAGTFPVDFNGINTEGFQQVGTPLNKANLLKDATAAQIGLPPSTTPDGMFQALGNTGELHVWRKTITSGTGTYSLGAVQEGLHYIKWANNSATYDSSGTFEYGSEIAVNNDGTITGIKNPSTITIKPWDDDASKANVFKGKFIKMISQVETEMSHFKIGEIWWIPADAVMTKGLLNGESGRWYIAASKRQQVVGVPAGTTTTYPVSTNPNAYQEWDDAKAAGYTLGEVKTGLFRINAVYNSTTIHYADSVNVSDNGAVTLAGQSYYGYGLSAEEDSYNNAKNLAGKFIIAVYDHNYCKIPKGVVLFIPANTTISFRQDVPGDEGYGIFFDRYQPVTGYAAIPAGTTIEYLGKLGDKRRVQAGSYVGTGGYSSNSPNKLMFNFAPKLVIVSAYVNTKFTTVIFVYDNYMATYSRDADMYLSELYVNWLKNGISWYTNDSTAESQLNYSGRTYKYIAIG